MDCRCSWHGACLAKGGLGVSGLSEVGLCVGWVNMAQAESLAEGGWYVCMCVCVCVFVSTCMCMSKHKCM